MKRTHRILGFVLAIVVAGSGIYLLASRLSAPEQVTIVTYRQPASLSVWVAQDMGFFRTRGLDVRLLEFSGAGLAAQVLASGGADIGGMPTVLAMQDAEDGIPLRLVHATGDWRAGTSQLLVRSSLAIGSLEDLQGRRVGFEDLEPTCLPCVAFQQVLDASGISVARVAVPDYKVEEALNANVVDAAVVTSPYNTFAVQRGSAYVLMDPRLGPAGDASVAAYGVAHPSGGIAEWMGSAAYWTTAPYLAAKPDVVHRVAQAIADAAAWLRDPQNLPAARDILIKYAGGLGSPEYFQAASGAVLDKMEWRSYPDGYVDWRAMEAQGEAYAAVGLVRGEVDVRALVSTPWFQA